MTVYLDKEGVLVDSSKIVIHGTTYPLRNISSYKDIHTMKDVWDFKQAVVVCAGASLIFTGVTVFGAWLLGYGIGSAGLITTVLMFVVVFTIMLIVDRHNNLTTRREFAFTALSLTVAGTTKSVLVVTDETNDLVYDVKNALDQAIADYR